VLALHDVSLTVGSSETVVLLGTNGNGKSSLMKCVMGLLRPSAGAIVARIGAPSIDLVGLATEEIVALGVILVPEGRHLLPMLTVEENLYLRALRRQARPHIRRTLEASYDLFPRLAERRGQPAGSMSGGEQQMVALASALKAEPKILLIGEPSVGLAPIVVKVVIDAIVELRSRLPGAADPPLRNDLPHRRALSGTRVTFAVDGAGRDSAAHSRDWRSSRPPSMP
jgi:branched-chain amino acid transport system ATP-binding protein